MTPYYIYNGILKKYNDPFITPDNRAFLYGDGFFETIYAYYDKIPFLHLHLNRILEAAKTFSMELPPEIIDISQLKKIILFLAHKNKIYKSYRIRITFFRKHGGLYKPEHNEAQYLIAISKLDFDPGNKNLKIVNLAFDEKITKDYSLISQFKTISPLPVLGAISAEQKKANDLLIFNSHGYAVETTNSNIFAYIDGKLITPPLSSGCVNGITRHIIINNVSPSLNIKVIEKNLTKIELNKASEIFITNSINFISFVKKFEQTFYLNSITNNIHKEFLKFLQSKVFENQ